MLTQDAPPITFPGAISHAVRDAAIEFFGAYCGMMPSEEADAPSEKPSAGIMGVISFFGDHVWSFALVLPEPTAITVSKAFAGMDIPFDSSDMGDLVGEMANVMAGDIVARLENSGIKAQMSLPTVARGHDVELLPPSNACSVKMQFSSPTGGFWFRLVKAPDGKLSARRPGT
jgi:CheY-specific phosphatase CheX